MKKVVDLNSQRSGWEFDEITGAWYNPADYPNVTPEIWVISIDNGPNGIGIAHACFFSESEAKRWQLENGCRDLTKLVRFN